MLFRFEEILKALGGTFLNEPRGEGVDAVTTDTRAITPNSLFIALSGERFDGHDFLDAALKQGASLLCIERTKLDKLPAGAPAIAVDSTVAAYQALARFHRLRLPVKAIALTGSSGKTSTKEMLRAIFVRAFGAEHVLATEGNTNNQIGVPLNLLKLTPEHKFCIIECGTNHHGEIEPLSNTIRPDAALIVSIGRCHLENLGSLEGVATEKSKLFTHLAPDGTAVIPLGAAGFDIMLKAAAPREIRPYGTGEGSVMEAFYRGGNINGSSFELLNHRTGERVTVNWSLSGAHQAHNAAGAAAVADAFGISMQTIAEGLAACVLPGMRMKRTEHNGAVWLNDAYNANPDSMKAALAMFREYPCKRRFALLGDMLELGDFSREAHEEVGRQAADSGVNLLVTYGEQARRTAVTAAARGLPTFHADTYQQAAEVLLERMQPGDALLVKASRGMALEKVLEIFYKEQT